MKKLVLALTSVALLAAGCNQAADNGSQNNGQTNNQDNNSGQDTQLTSLITYKNDTYGFEFSYDKEFGFVTPTYANLQDKIVQIQLPGSAYPKTNFGDAALSVSAAYTKSLTDCLKISAPENSDGFKTKVQLAGRDFYMTKGSGAGAGNLYESTTYRTLSGGQTCIELNETIHTAQIGNFPAGTVTEVDKADVQRRLDAVLQSFTFNK